MGTDEPPSPGSRSPGLLPLHPSLLYILLEEGSKRALQPCRAGAGSPLLSRHPHEALSSENTPAFVPEAGPEPSTAEGSPASSVSISLAPAKPLAPTQMPQQGCLQKQGSQLSRVFLGSLSPSSGTLAGTGETGSSLVICQGSCRHICRHLLAKGLRAACSFLSSLSGPCSIPMHPK